MSKDRNLTMKYGTDGQWKVVYFPVEYTEKGLNTLTKAALIDIILAENTAGRELEHAFNSQDQTIRKLRLDLEEITDERQRWCERVDLLHQASKAMLRVMADEEDFE